MDFEYVLARRGRNGVQFFYELVYAGEGETRDRFVMGLIDVEKLRRKTAKNGDSDDSDSRKNGDSDASDGKKEGFDDNLSG